MVVDIIALVVMLASVVIAILRGFIRELLTIFGMFGGAVAAFVGGPMLSPYMRGWLGVVEGAEEPPALFGILPYSILAEILAYGLIFIVFVIFLSVLSHFLAESVRNLGLGAVDRTLGMVFGIIRGVLFLGLLYLPIYKLVSAEQMKDWPFLETSKSRVYLEMTSRWIDGFIPSAQDEEESEEDKSLLNEGIKKLEELDLLNSDENSDQPAENKLLSPKKLKEGYTDDFREKMDKLIEDTTKSIDPPKKQYNE